jgi:hypothetical protein
MTRNDIPVGLYLQYEVKGYAIDFYRCRPLNKKYLTYVSDRVPGLSARILLKDFTKNKLIAALKKELLLFLRDKRKVRPVLAFATPHRGPKLTSHDPEDSTHAPIMWRMVTG